MSQQLQKLWKSFPLPFFKQGSTLSIRSPNPSVPLSIRIIPEWRDDALLNLKQVLGESEQEMEMKVEMETDPSKFKMTSLGRKAALATVHLDWKQQTESAWKDLSTSAMENGIESKMLKQEKTKETPAYGFANTRDGCEFNPLPEDIILEDYKDEDFDKAGNYGLDTNNGFSILTAKLPQQSNITCHLAGIGDISITKKLEGDASLSTYIGNVTTHQLRGYNINIETVSGNIVSTKNIEAQTIHLNIQQKGTVSAKMINGSNINIDVPLDGVQTKDDSDLDTLSALVDISALYTSQSGEGAHIQMKPPTETSMIESKSAFTTNPRHVRVKSHHGHLTVNTYHPPFAAEPLKDKYDNIIPLVELGGMNGSCDVSIHPNDKTPSIEDSSVMAARVHVDSLAPNTISVLTANKGDIGITVDRKVDTDLCLISSPSVSSLPLENILEAENKEDVQALLEKFDSDISTELGIKTAPVTAAETRIRVDGSSFTSSVNQNPLGHVQYEYGQVSNKSQEPDSRFDVQTKGISSRRGKINVENAALQALHGFTKQDPENFDIISNKSAQVSDKNLDPAENESERSYEWPFMGVATSGSIKVETVDWLGAIARRYGMGDTRRDKENLGRQAKKSIS